MCVAGVATRLPDGYGYGMCACEITPAPEACGTIVDDDCDGQVNEEGADCACAPNDEAPCYTGPGGTENVGACHGGTQLCNPFGTGWGACIDVFVAKYSPSGQHLWSKRYGVESGGGDTVVVTGAFFGTIDLGLGSMVSAGSSDLFVGRLGPNGAALWQKRYGDTGSQSGIFAAVDFANAVLVGGTTQGTVDFGDGPLTPIGGGSDLVLAKLAP